MQGIDISTPPKKRIPMNIAIDAYDTTDSESESESERESVIEKSTKTQGHCSNCGETGHNKRTCDDSFEENYEGSSSEESSNYEVEMTEGWTGLRVDQHRLHSQDIVDATSLKEQNQALDRLLEVNDIIEVTKQFITTTFKLLEKASISLPRYIKLLDFEKRRRSKLSQTLGKITHSKSGCGK